MVYDKSIASGTLSVCFVPEWYSIMNRIVESGIQLNDIDTRHAVEIAEQVWWVGHYLPGDKFQCHAYLIENGDQSVLIDPGSQLTLDGTLRKIEEIIPFSKIFVPFMSIICLPERFCYMACWK